MRGDWCTLRSLNGALMPLMAEDVAIVTCAANLRLAGVDRCGLVLESAAMSACYQDKA